MRECVHLYIHFTFIKLANNDGGTFFCLEVVCYCSSVKKSVKNKLSTILGTSLALSAASVVNLCLVNFVVY